MSADDIVAAGTSFAVRPITATSSTSQSTACEYGGSFTVAPGPTTEAGVFRKCHGFSPSSFRFGPTGRFSARAISAM